MIKAEQPVDSRFRGAKRAAHFVAAALLALVGAATAQQPYPPAPAGQAGAVGQANAGTRGQRITPSFKDADITQIVEAVSAATGKNFIIDPRVRAQVTMLSSTPMSPAAFYEAFLAILQVHGFIAVQSGDIVKIMPDANARQFPANDLPNHVSATSDEIVTQVLAVRNVSAAQLVPVLRPLIPQYGHLAAIPSSNMLIISDRANNVNRIVRIIDRIDEAGDSDIDVIQLRNGSAAEIVRVVNSLIQGQAGADAGGALLKVVADERSNSVLLTGERAARLRAKALIAHLDTPLENGGDTQVRYLRYAQADKLAAKLKEQAAATPGTPAAAGGAAASVDKSTTIWADVGTNALVITAPPKTMRALMNVIDKLDIRRLQVHLEAIIVEVTTDKTEDLGVNWLVASATKNTSVPVGGFISPVGGTSIADLVAAAENPTALTSASIPTGATLAVGRLATTGVNFAAMIRAIQGVANTNIIATPSVVTMDNQEATIKIAQEVPFITGQYTNTGTTTTGTVNPFETVQRQEVGTILKITPQINEGDAVILKIDEESSSIAASSKGAVDLITNKRTISTNVLIEDRGTLVLGGLIQDSSTGSEQNVPFLNRIPLIGELFRARTGEKTKTNLFFFIKPTILRDQNQSIIETNQKYEYMRDEQRRAGPGFEVLPILPGMKEPALPAMKQPPVTTVTPPRTSGSVSSSVKTPPTPPAPAAPAAPAATATPATPPAAAAPATDGQPAPTDSAAGGSK